MRFQVLSLIAVVGLVAACSTAPTTETGSAAGQGAAQTQITPGSAEDLRVNVGDRVFFGFDMYNLTDQARGTLQKQAAWLSTHSGVNVIIEGHCDERGTREYNLALGERRANAVSDYMVSLGVPSSRISTISYGKERPEDPASNEMAWSKNRRGVTVVK
ncbi:MAG: peptidoglycan-associated lipoprotein Pal [Alphaproteobacteria bacterium]|nr:peptidoglycan-associated lipoprotein Pal [Alphaproteobacteria bacterium]MBF0250701.1 peptidoglycan-associated lipoprotein Pal [Alphaproteobacteria bacterium]